MRLRNFVLGLVAIAAAFTLPAVAQSNVPNYGGYQASLTPTLRYAPVTFTATAQTSTAQTLSGASFGLFQVKGTALTTVTFNVQGSIDGGATYFTIPFAVATGYTTRPLTTESTATATASTLYAINLAGLTNIKFVTSGTFTATNVTISLTATSNVGVL
jgi:hypothetical protein